MAKEAFTVLDGGIKWIDSVSGVQKGSSAAGSFNIRLAKIIIPPGLPIYNVRVEPWEGHSVNGTDSTDYHNFQDLLAAAGLTMC